MIPLRARLLASRHRDIVGKPLRSWRIGAGPALPLLLLGILVLLGILLALNPNGSWAGNVAFLLFFAILLGLAYLFTVDARLVVCERGVLMGRLIPGLPLSPTYVIGGREIDPRTVCVVSNGVKAANEVGMGPLFPQFFMFPPAALGQRAVSFNGPWGNDIAANREITPHRPVRKSLFMFSRRNAGRIADEILHAIGRDGAIPAGFRPHQGLQVIAVTGNRQDAMQQIPGAWPPGSAPRR
ncbi:hypothetical protein [Brachybacterium sp. FME24]|uniref:hypothetical protein n=1 Tax=Brachybacterium sp. FME24 TaxID=2742605 RepID=UPI001867AB57|nr:hypothetical protein [Brachybacterium sp. FME24]